MEMQQKIKDEEATPAMWFLLEVFSRMIIDDRHEIKMPEEPKRHKKTGRVRTAGHADKDNQ